MRIALWMIVLAGAGVWGIAAAGTDVVAAAKEEPAAQPAAKLAKRGRAAVVASAARTKIAPDEREYTFDVWDTDNVASVSGFVTTKGLPEMSGGDLGDVRWRVAGSAISGYLMKNGSNVAKFEGVLATDGAVGTIRTAGGHHGTWVWDGPLPEVERREREK